MYKVLFPLSLKPGSPPTDQWGMMLSNHCLITAFHGIILPTNCPIYGDRIVWQDIAMETDDIYMYDLSSHKETQITNRGSATNPAIYGDRIVWKDDRNGNGANVYMYNLSTSNGNPDYHQWTQHDRILLSMVTG